MFCMEEMVQCQIFSIRRLIATKGNDVVLSIVHVLLHNEDGSLFIQYDEMHRCMHNARDLF